MAASEYSRGCRFFETALYNKIGSVTFITSAESAFFSI